MKIKIKIKYLNQILVGNNTAISCGMTLCMWDVIYASKG